MGLKILVSAKSLPRTRNPSRENFEPEEGFFDSGRNLQIPPVASGNYRLLAQRFRRRWAFERVSDQCRMVRWGGDCYAYGLLAMGQVDLVVESSLKAFDIQALIPIIEAAGGRVTNWQGGTCYDGGQILAAANADIHKAAMEALNG